MNHSDADLTAEHEQRIQDAVHNLLQQIPTDVTLVAAAKTRSIAEVRAAITAGIRHIGQNYIQDAQRVIPALKDQARWHMIGHLQRNKLNKAIPLFDMIESVDSLPLAQNLSERCEKADKPMQILLEINTGREQAKSGILPEETMQLITEIQALPFLQLGGLMTMGPRFGDPQDARPYFQLARKLFEEAQRALPPEQGFQFLSMGMSNSYQVAIEEGANLIRIGTAIFGPRTT